MQYNSKRKDEFLDKYMNALNYKSIAWKERSEKYDNCR